MQDESHYYWASTDHGTKVARKTSWKMSNGSIMSEDSGAKAGAKYTEAEWQQMVLGLKRENKENVERLRKEHDEDLFKVRVSNIATAQFQPFSIFFLFLIFLSR